MTVAEIRTGTEEQLKCSFTPQKGPWKAVEFLRQLNIQQDTVHAMIAALNEGAFETSQDLNEVANVALISLPTNLYKLRKLARIKGGSATAAKPARIDPIARTIDEEEYAREVGTTQQVEFYQQRGQKTVELFPTPSASQNASIRATYIYKPAPLVSDTDVPFQITAGGGGAGLDSFSEWHDILMLGVIVRLLDKNKEHEKAAQYRQDRMERVQHLTAFLKPMNSQEPRTVRYTGSPHDALYYND